MRSRLRGEELTSAHGAGVVVVKPEGDAVGADEVTARKADQALYDTGFGRQRAHFLMALAHAWSGSASIIDCASKCLLSRRG